MKFMGKIPIAAAKQFAEENDCKQVIIFALSKDGKTTHVVTYGKTIEDCAQAADGANEIKKGWGWPASTLQEPSRIRKLQSRIKDLEEALKASISE